MADGHSKIVVKFELYEGKDKNLEKNSLMNSNSVSILTRASFETAKGITVSH